MVGGGEKASLYPIFPAADYPTAMRFSALAAFRAAAVLGFLGVALGAFGAHGLEPLLKTRGMVDVWNKAVLYHFLHTLVLLGLPFLRPFPAGAWLCLGAGVLGFSGSLYAYAVWGIHWLVFVTPLGGLCFLAGWLWLALAARRFVAAE